jgi:ubiquinone/menaquinone biosynthesis C-methylase UbiE
LILTPLPLSTPSERTPLIAQSDLQTTRDHYSYSVYADPATAQTFDARRFGGPIGELLAESQARVLLDFAAPAKGQRILDVGSGTGRAALELAQRGAEVTGIDASEEMLAVARQRADDLHVTVRFQTGDAHALDFPDRSFDTVVSLRVLMHTPDWRRCLIELCRVSNAHVVIDYPSSHSAAALQSAARRILHVFGARTEPYRVFTDRVIYGVLEQSGFRVRTVHRQWVLPIALHKAINSRRLTLALERLLDRLGLLKRFGSPITLVADRCDIS